MYIPGFTKAPMLSYIFLCSKSTLVRKITSRKVYRVYLSYNASVQYLPEYVLHEIDYIHFTRPTRVHVSHVCNNIGYASGNMLDTIMIIFVLSTINYVTRKKRYIHVVGYSRTFTFINSVN